MDKKILFSKIGILLLSILIASFFVVKYTRFGRESIIVISITSVVIFYILDSIYNFRRKKKNK